MSESTTIEAEVIQLRESIGHLVRRRVVEAIETVLEEELDAALGTSRYERSEERRGYRNGHQPRRVTTATGTAELSVPRARLEGKYDTNRIHFLGFWVAF